MLGWLVYSEERLQRNQEYARMHERWCASHGIDLTLVLAERVTYGMGPAGMRFRVAGEPVPTPDFCVFRCEETDLRRVLELCGTVVANGSYIGKVANDKLRTYELAHALGVPYPEILSVGMPSRLGQVYPVVAKPRYGHGGEGVRLIANSSELEEYASERANERWPHAGSGSTTAALRVDRSWVVQRVAPVAGKDLRVYVLGGEVLAAMLRTAPAGSFLSNYCRGGSASVYELGARERDVVLRVARALGDGYYGIDFLFDDDDKILLNEVEDVVGSRMLYWHTTVDVVGEHLEHVVAQCKVRDRHGVGDEAERGGVCGGRYHG